YPRQRSGQCRKAPGQRINTVQIYPALRSKERVLSGGAHAHSPPSKVQKNKERAIDGNRCCDQHGRPKGYTCAAEQGERRVYYADRLRRILLRGGPEQHDYAKKENAKRKGRKNSREPHPACHLAKKRNIDEAARQ